MAEVRPTFEFDKSDRDRLLMLMDEYYHLSKKTMNKVIDRTTIQWLKSAKSATPSSKTWRRNIRNKKRRHGALDAYFVEIYKKTGARIFRVAPTAKSKIAFIKFKGAAKKVWSGLIGQVNKSSAVGPDPFVNKYGEIAFRRGALPQITVASKLRYIEILDKKHHIEAVATTKAARELDYQIRVMRGEIEKKSRKK
jgi:hypothetical protein